MKDKLIIISGADSHRYNAHLNHQKYADIQKVEYRFYLKTDLENPYFTKCYAILDCFEKEYDYVLWIDDDAFFIDMDWNFFSLFEEYPDDIIVTRGITKKSGTAYFNNGIMFLRNSNITKKLFNLIPQIPWEEVEKNWDSNWGPCWGNDQPRMIYLTQKFWQDSIHIVDYPGFNVNEITFKKKGSFPENYKPPIVHITGDHKQQKLERFLEHTKISLF